MRHRLLLAVLLAACSDDGGDDTKAVDDAGARDAQASDARVADAQASDARTADATTADAHASDAQAPASDSATAPPAGTRYFPDGAFMYQRVDSAAVDPDSSTITSWLKNNGGWGNGAMQIDFTIEVLAADATTPKRSFTPTDDFYTPDCDPAPIPVPANGALEGEDGYACTHDGDCHLLVVSHSENRLYEMWRANVTGSTFYGGCAVVWDMSRVYGADGRGEQCTSADAGGFPIAPLLFSADEVKAGSVDHAIRFILPNERMRAKTYQHPGTHAGSPSGPTSAPIYGSRWRLKSSFDLSKLPSDAARTVARGLQQYGMVLADGGNVALTAQSDRFTTAKWKGLLAASDLASIQPTDFEVVESGDPIASTNDCERTPITQ